MLRESLIPRRMRFSMRKSRAATFSRGPAAALSTTASSSSSVVRYLLPYKLVIKRITKPSELTCKLLLPDFALPSNHMRSSEPVPWQLHDCKATLATGCCSKRKVKQSTNFATHAPGQAGLQVRDELPQRCSLDSGVARRVRRICFKGIAAAQRASVCAVRQPQVWQQHAWQRLCAGKVQGKSNNAEECNLQSWRTGMSRGLVHLPVLQCADARSVQHWL